MFCELQAWIIDVNHRIALWITSAVGTMACAYFFLFLAILGFPAHGSSPSIYVQWLSQTCIQLVMLSVIMVGQRVMDEKNHRRHVEHMDLHGQASSPKHTAKKHKMKR